MPIHYPKGEQRTQELTRMDPQMQERLMTYAGFIPGTIAMVLLLAAWYFHAFKASRTDLDDDLLEEEADEPRPVSPGPRWLLPILLAVGVAGADYAINDGFQMWPDSNNDRFTHAILLIALVGVAEGLVKLPLFVAFAMRLLAYAGAFWMLTEGYTEVVLGSTANLIGYTLAAALATALVATAADRNAVKNHHDRKLGWLDALTWVMIMGAIMPVSLKNEFAIGSMLPAGIIAVMVSATIVGLVFSSFSIARGGISTLAGFVMMIFAGICVQAELTNLPSVLLAMLLPLVTTIPLVTESRIRRLIARAILIGVVGGSAALFAFQPTQVFGDPAGEDGEQVESLDDYYNNLD
ncbi:MAG: hypothetical protein HRT64_11600 [Erythrobacter sp.]|nr:hypothetical protein [Erythrobacter sp.]